MMTRNKKKGGRGYTRDDWIKFHEQIAYKSGKRDTGSSMGRSDKNLKPTETNTINSGHAREQIVNQQSSEVHTARVIDQISLGKESKASENKLVQKGAKSDTMDVDKNEHTPAKQVESNVLNGLLQHSTELVTQENNGENNMVNIDEYSNNKESIGLVTSFHNATADGKRFPSVQIKKECVEQTAAKQFARETNETDALSSQTSSSNISDDMDLTVEDSDGEDVSMDQEYVVEDAEGPIKRKSVMKQNKQSKRLNTNNMVTDKPQDSLTMVEEVSGDASTVLCSNATSLPRTVVTTSAQENISKVPNTVTVNQTPVQFSQYLDEPKKNFRTNGRFPQVKIVTEHKEVMGVDLKTRGQHLVDNKEVYRTPIKIEFNVDNKANEFNLLAEFNALLSHLTTQDPGLRLLDHTTEKVIWETGQALPEKEDFHTAFQTREQSFRTGNKKVSVYCVVEAMSTINRMKYAEPTKSYIFEHNIWIKPDFYFTKVVSSPGFFTLVHPKWTNKIDFTEQIKTVLQTTEINVDEFIVVEWRKQKGYENHEGNIIVPNFHMETTTRKWGGLQTDVLSVQCATEDAKYLKYLLSAAGSTDTLPKGIFVPTGIHLMEGKEVLHQLLQEQIEFLNTVTSFQIGGINCEEMYQVKENQWSIHQLLRNAAGVSAIERMFHTAYSGQWLIVVDKDSVNKLVDHISINLNKIYRTKQASTPKLITHSRDVNNTGYRLLFVDRSNRGVSTYAEVLTKRFPNKEVGDKFMDGKTTSVGGRIPVRTEERSRKEFRGWGVIDYNTDKGQNSDVSVAGKKDGRDGHARTEQIRSETDSEKHNKPDNNDMNKRLEYMQTLQNKINVFDQEIRSRFELME